MIFIYRVIHLAVLARLKRAKTDFLGNAAIKRDQALELRGGTHFFTKTQFAAGCAPAQIAGLE